MERSDFVNTLRAKFAKEHSCAFADIKAAIENSDLHKAFLLAHTLKISAGLIDEPKLAKATLAVELPLQEGNLPEVSALEHLGVVFEQVFSGVELPAKHNVQELSPESIKGLFEKLQPILEASSADCFMMLDELENVPDANDLIEAIESCDFENALQVLVDLRKKLSI